MAGQVYYSVEIGEECVDYQVPNFLGAVDSIVCMFSSRRCLNDEAMAEALELYVKHLRGDDGR